MKILSTEQICLLHSELIRETGGSDGIRDIGLLESAAIAPFQSYDGIDLYPSLQQKAARLGFGLIENHAFVDGNKRIGAHIMLVFLEINGISLSYSQDELSDIILDVASGKANCESLFNWIVVHEK